MAKLTDLHTRLLGLAHDLRDVDPDMMQWIVKNVQKERSKRVRRRRPLKAGLPGFKRSGEFEITPQRLDELTDAERLPDADSHYNAEGRP